VKNGEFIKIGDEGAGHSPCDIGVTEIFRQWLKIWVDGIKPSPPMRH